MRFCGELRQRLVHLRRPISLLSLRSAAKVASSCTVTQLSAILERPLSLGVLGSQTCSSHAPGARRVMQSLDKGSLEQVGRALCGCFRSLVPSRGAGAASAVLWMAQPWIEACCRVEAPRVRPLGRSPPRPAA